MTATAIDSAAETQPATPAAKKRVQGGLLDPKMLWKSTPDALRKLDPRTLWQPGDVHRRNRRRVEHLVGDRQ